MPRCRLDPVDRDGCYLIAVAEPRRQARRKVTAPPNFDQPHDRNAWVHCSMGDYPAQAAQIDNDTVIPFLQLLAKQLVFCDHHFGAGSNSTSGHMLATGGQTPTMKNPPFVGPHPVWDIPSIFTAAGERPDGSYDLRAGHLEAAVDGSESSPAIHFPSVARHSDRIGC